MRGLDRGMHFSRLDNTGVVHNSSIRLSVRRDGITYQFSGGRHVVVLPLEALWAVEEPFVDKSEETLKLIPPEVAPFAILLVFAMVSSHRLIYVSHYLALFGAAYALDTFHIYVYCYFLTSNM
jgi:hypothetical protein